MAQTEFYNWLVTDELTSKRRKTKHKMSRAQALERHPDAEPVLASREVRDLPEPGEVVHNTKPPQ